jgi:hypothetical protein
MSAIQSNCQYQTFPFQRAKKFPQIDIFGLKIYQLATFASDWRRKSALPVKLTWARGEGFFILPTTEIGSRKIFLSGINTLVVMATKSMTCNYF